MAEHKAVTAATIDREFDFMNAAHSAISELDTFGKRKQKNLFIAQHNLEKHAKAKPTAEARATSRGPTAKLVARDVGEPEPVDTGGASGSGIERPWMTNPVRQNEACGPGRGRGGDRATGAASNARSRSAVRPYSDRFLNREPSGLEFDDDLDDLDQGEEETWQTVSHKRPRSQSVSKGKASTHKGEAPWEANGVPRPPSPDRKVKGGKTGKGKKGKGTGKDKGKRPVDGANRHGPRADIQWPVQTGIPVLRTGPADPQASPSIVARDNESDSGPTYAKVLFNSQNQMIDVVGGHRDYIPVQVPDTMVSRDRVRCYRLWLEEQEAFLWAVQHNHSPAPVGAMLDFMPRCDVDVGDAEMRARAQTGTHEWVEVLDGCPHFCANCRVNYSGHSLLSCQRPVSIKTLLWFYNLEYYEKVDVRSIDDIEQASTVTLRLEEILEECREGPNNPSLELYHPPPQQPDMVTHGTVSGEDEAYTRLLLMSKDRQIYSNQKSWDCRLPLCSGISAPLREIGSTVCGLTLQKSNLASHNGVATGACASAHRCLL